jgi:hypothetical protein
MQPARTTSQTLFRTGVVATTLVLATLRCLASSQPIPVRFVDALPVVDVRLGDLGADFLLDTGGQIGITVPRPLINAATQVVLRDGFEKTTDAAGHMFSVQKLKALRVALGGMELGPVDGLVHYRWGLEFGGDAPEAHRGVIGFGALSSHNVLFDLGHGTFTLFERGGNDRPDLAAWRRLPFEYDSRGLVLRLSVNGIPATMVLDTGATTAVIRKDAAIFAKTASPCAHAAADAEFCGEATLRATAEDGRDFGPVKVAIVRMGGVPFDGLLGIDFFRTHELFVDFDARALYVREAKAAGPSRR